MNLSKICIRNLILLILLFVPMQVSGQFQAMVNQAKAVTDDGISFRVWINKRTVSPKQDTIIYYEIENRSRKTIYLIRQRGEIETAVTDGSLLLMIPIPFPDDHRDNFNYEFTKVTRGQKFRGELKFPSSAYNESRRWSIIVAFGFVTNITGLDRKLRFGEDPAPLRGLLSSRIETVGLGGLTIEVKKS